MSTHNIETYQRADSKWSWRINVGGDIVATDGGQGYENKKDMLNSLFGIFFGTFDESFLTLYQEWNPEGNNQGVPSSEVVGDDIPSVEEQAGAVNPGDNLYAANQAQADAVNDFIQNG
jgi:hypothetical protein